MTPKTLTLETSFLQPLSPFSRIAYLDQTFSLKSFTKWKTGKKNAED